jgi:hypothetical protein
MVVVALVAGGIDPVAGGSLAVLKGYQDSAASAAAAGGGDNKDVFAAVVVVSFVGLLRHLYPCPTRSRHHCKTRAVLVRRRAPHHSIIGIIRSFIVGQVLMNHW